MYLNQKLQKFLYLKLTVEGFMDKFLAEIIRYTFNIGDSSVNNLNDFVMKLRDLQQLKKKFTFI